MKQDQALDLMKMGQNIFLTGPAGSGKTFLLNRYIAYLQANEIPVAVTASTGIAATHMNGRTIHSWAAIGTNTRLTKKQLNSIFRHEETYSRIRSAKVLIIDEISMLDAQRFELIDTVCRKVRESAAVFGGLQVILSGDFFQLPPVRTAGEPEPEFVFMSKVWDQADIHVCYLDEQYRQSDRGFLAVLNDIRGSTVTEDTVAALETRSRKPIDGFPSPTKLYTHNDRVDQVNADELAKIESEALEYRMLCEGPKALVAQLKESCLALDQLFLKKGAFVMFIKNNFEGGYANGTLGTVIGFDPNGNNPIVRKRDGTALTIGPQSWVSEDDNGDAEARISQIPLRLAWALTVHKSQGMSLDCAEIDLSRAFTEGMGYVALSRVRTLAGIKLMGLNPMALRVSEVITEHDSKFRELSDHSVDLLMALAPAKRDEAIDSFIAKNR